jgi:hypothetical protein
MGLKALYMFINPKLDSNKHRAEIETPENGKMFFIGVNSIEEGIKIAESFVQDGIELIELCGGFGYEGTARIQNALGDKIPVGIMVHQVWNAAQLAKLIK